MRDLAKLVVIAGIQSGACGCGDVGAKMPDAGDTPIDGSPCDLTASFGAASIVPGATNVPDASVTNDELTIYYDGPGNTPYVTTRPTRTMGFPQGAPVPGVPNSVFAPSTNKEQTILWLHSGQAMFLYMIRATTSDPFVSLTSTGVSGAHGFASSTALYFGGTDIMRAPVTGTSLGTPMRLDALATAASENQPVISRDDLELAFMRGDDLVVASRASTVEAFGNMKVQSLGVTASDPAGFSDDRCYLYFTVMTGGAQELHVASRGR